MKEKDYCL